MQLFGSCLGFAVLKKNPSLLEGLEFTPACEGISPLGYLQKVNQSPTQTKPYNMLRVLVNKMGYIPTWYVYKIFFFIFRLMRYTDVCFLSLPGVLFRRE